ncbi:MAG TPA: DUF3078 domain-containing protein [Candidatus Krumholzibacteriaceae bacterium]|nr:DUF3078 domain-containing protein [Candidatus Krumholzibacteriaceae bacterium]
MPKWFVLFAALLLVAAAGKSAEPWNLSADANLTFTENSYSDNWAGGEAGALSWLFSSNSLAEKQLHRKVNTRNTLKLFFGQTHSQEAESNRWREPVVSNDLIDFESLLRFTLESWIEPFVSGRIETQFLDAGDPRENLYINPVTFTESAGVSKVLVKDEKTEWMARIGAGARQYLDQGNTTEKDGGLTFDSEVKTKIADDQISLESKLTVFKALAYSNEDEAPNDYWKCSDVKWETILTAGITKYLMVNLYFQLLYDKQIDLGGRFKQSLSLGLTYKLI